MLCSCHSSYRLCSSNISVLMDVAIICGAKKHSQGATGFAARQLRLSPPLPLMFCMLYITFAW